MNMKIVGQVDCYYAAEGKWWKKGRTMKKFMEKFEDLKTKEERKKVATALFNSIRGQYLLGQALYLAIEHMEERPEFAQETSNMADMGLMMEQLFPMFAGVEEAKAEFEKERAKNVAERLG
jgi:hypothetical protein